MSTYIQGKNEVLAVWTGTVYEPIVCLTSSGFSESVSEVSGRTRCDANGATQRVAGAVTYEIPFEGLYAEAEADKLSWVGLKTKLRALENVDWRLTTTYSDNSTDIEYGNAFFSNLEKSGEVDEFITFSGTLMGNGLTTDTDPNA